MSKSFCVAAAAALTMFATQPLPAQVIEIATTVGG